MPVEEDIDLSDVDLDDKDELQSGTGRSSDGH